ncbi:hypothetical protein [uncultured Nocardioides sp.]|uniref:hypothetical protein n=1 Tax=uncultured Nocardioides sp. TaxID=198441 RepID=UPI00260D7901|nr:hypothetical protein [uncultured Nocardioides sp.]
MTNQNQGGGGGQVNLTVEKVHQIADRLRTESDNVAGSDFAALPLGAVHFGASTAGADLGGHYEGAFADAVNQNDECVTMLGDYAVNLRGSVQDQLDSDTLNAVALRQIGNFDPGKD